MAIQMSDIRNGAGTIGAMFQQANNDSKRPNKVTSPEEVKKFVGDHGLDQASGDMMKAVLRYTQARSHTRSVTSTQVGGALQEATRNIAKAARDATEGSGSDRDAKQLSKAEFDRMAKTWKAIASFVQAHPGATLEDILC